MPDQVTNALFLNLFATERFCLIAMCEQAIA